MAASCGPAMTISSTVVSSVNARMAAPQITIATGRSRASLKPSNAACVAEKVAMCPS